MHEGRVLVSLHDVSPRHAQAVETILAHLRQLQLPPVVLLVVPDFHGKWPLADHADFCQRLLTLQRSGYELALHGYYHLEDDSGRARAASVGDILRRRFMTAGEGEFLALPPEAARERIRQGLAMWDSVGLDRPEGFVPPAWLHRPDLSRVLWDEGFRWTENHGGLQFSHRAPVSAPVITWASRDPLRRIGSRLYAPTALRASKKAPLVRIAIHPHDWDHPTLIRSITATLLEAIRTRSPLPRPGLV